MAVQSLRVSAKVNVKPEALVASSTHARERSLDHPYPDIVYDALFDGEKKPLTVDCTQPGVVCKFPVVVTEKEDSSKPAKQVKPVPIIRGVDDKAELGNDEKDIILVPKSEKSNLASIVRSGDIESIFADKKDVDETWILEKNVLNKKYQFPVKLVPSKGYHSGYPSHHEFHDHYSGGDPYYYPYQGMEREWTPWARAYPSQQPCQTPVYNHQPPPCSSGVYPSKRPTINIDDKIEKD